MPELPEVETIKNDLSRLIVGRKIENIWTDSPKMVQPSLSIVKVLQYSLNSSQVLGGLLGS